MNLIDRIRRALDDGPVDATEFERCAVALLTAVYPGLSAVEGGHDFGRDADIYFPHDPDATRRGRLLATTGKARDNVARGLTRMKEEGIHADLIVVACTTPLTARQRTSIEDLCRDFGVDDAHIYARDWLVENLAKRPEWREKVLHISGELGSLLRLPVTLQAQPDPLPDLVGRDEDVRSLRTALDSGCDVIVSGAAGIGKTRVVSSLGDNVLFLEPATPDRVIDDLRAHKPTAVIVDDAHGRAEELALLRRARLQEGLSFRIVATTWPDRAGDIAAELPGYETHHLDVLDGASMDAIVQSTGITGYYARMVILRQAEGRAGWALALCDMVRTGKAGEVVTGTAFADHVEGFLRRATQSAVAVDTLACIAALRQVGDDELSVLAGMIGIPLGEMTDLLTRVARHGLLDHVGGAWRLQPALRGPLIARWFFRDPPMRAWTSLVTAPGHETDLLDAALETVAVGADTARPIVDAWISSLPDVTAWDAATWNLVDKYAALGSDEATWAVDAAVRCLEHPRPTRTVLNVTLDPSGDTARGLLVAVARQHLHPAAIRALLDMAVTGPRGRPQDPDDPVRVLGDLACRIDPDFGTNTLPRRRVVEATAAWIAVSARERWPLGAEVIEAAMSPRVSGTWQGPGDQFTLTFSQGVDPAANLVETVTLWISVDKLLRSDHDVPPGAIRYLLDLTDEWLRLGAARVPERDEVDEAQTDAGAAGGRAFLDSLRPHIAKSPGLALRAQQLLDDLQVTDIEPFAVDDDMVDLVGRMPAWRADDYEAHHSQRRREVEALAERIAALEVPAAVARVVELQRQADLLGDRSDLYWLADILKERMHNPHAWLTAAREESCAPLVQAALERVLTTAPLDANVTDVRAALADPTTRVAAISAALTATTVTEPVAVVLTDLTGEDVWIFERLFVRNADEVLYALLTHPVRAVRSAAAISFAVGTPHGPALPENWRSTWEDAVRDLHAEELDQHSRWRAGELLKHLAKEQPALFTTWFDRRLDEEIADGYVREPEPHGCRNSLTVLPRELRAPLARKIAGVPRFGGTLLTELLGHDRTLAEELLDDGSVSLNYLGSALCGQRNDVLLTLGPLLVSRGVDPESVAEAAGSVMSFIGRESEAHAATEKYFQSLGEAPDSALRAIGEAGIRQQQILYAHALRREIDERRRGY